VTSNSKAELTPKEIFRDGYMVTGIIHITKHDGTKDMIAFPSVWQAEYYLSLIPVMQVDGNEYALTIYSAKLGRMTWTES
jgi:hypothetical protein